MADCVCLMGLGHMTAVPVDVHVCRLAIRDYASHLPPHLAALKSLSTANYKIIGETLVYNSIISRISLQGHLPFNQDI